MVREELKAIQRRLRLQERVRPRVSDYESALTDIVDREATASRLKLEKRVLHFDEMLHPFLLAFTREFYRRLDKDYIPLYTFQVLEDGHAVSIYHVRWEAEVHEFSWFLVSLRGMEIAVQGTHPVLRDVHIPYLWRVTEDGREAYGSLWGDRWSQPATAYERFGRNPESDHT